MKFPPLPAITALALFDLHQIAGPMLLNLKPQKLMDRRKRILVPRGNHHPPTRLRLLKQIPNLPPAPASSPQLPAAPRHAQTSEYQNLRSQTRAQYASNASGCCPDW